MQALDEQQLRSIQGGHTDPDGCTPTYPWEDLSSL